MEEEEEEEEKLFPDSICYVLRGFNEKIKVSRV